MTETTARVALACPACSPSAETVHEVLNPRGKPTVRCTDCGHVHKSDLPETRRIKRDVIISQDDESFHATAEPPEDELLAVGEEFLVETDEAIMSVRITSLEGENEQRFDEAPAEEIQTIWTRAVGNVSVRVTSHPKSGRHDETRSFKLQVPGDYEFTVGGTETLGGEEFTVEGIHLRRDVHGYNHEKLDFEGDMAFAKDVNRLYVRDEATSAWSAW